MFYVVATILVMLSITLAMNGFFTAEQIESARLSISSGLSGFVIPGADSQGTIYDTYCYVHNQYYGLRF